MRTFVVSIPLFLSLGLDTFAVAVGLGISGLDRRERLRFGVSFAAAEGLMPLVGFLLGRVVAAALGDVASYVAIALLLSVGLNTVWEALQEEEREYQASSILRLVLLAFSVSMDELAIGFGLGLLHISVVLAAAFIAAQAFVVTMVGTALGRRVREVVAGRAELLSGVILSLVAVLLLGEKAVAH